MKQKSLSQQWNKRTKAFLKYLSKCRKGFDEEDIHELRVSVKKLRAILSLAELAKAKPKKIRQIEKTFVPLFKASGKLREIQLARQYLDETPGLFADLIQKHLAEKEIPLRKKFRKRIKTFKSDQLKGFSNIRLSKEADAVATAIHQLAKYRTSINDSFHENASDSELHNVRKALKGTMETMNYLKRIYPADDLRSIRRQTKVLALKMGDWHDYAVLINMLVVYALNMDELPDSAPEIIQFFEEKRMLLKTEIMQAIPELSNVMDAAISRLKNSGLPTDTGAYPA